MVVPINLVYYYVPRLLVENLAETKESGSASPGGPMIISQDELVISGEPAVNPDNELSWRIALNIRTKKRSKKNPNELPWHFEMDLHGYFDITEVFREREDYEKLLTVNGLSILWSLARELIHQSTSHSPIATAMLPSVKFNPVGSPVLEATLS